MRKRILSLLCAVAIIVTMLSVGAVYVFGTSNAMLTAKYVDDSGKTVSNLSAGDEFWAVFSLNDYDALVGGNGDKNVSAVSVNVALDADKFEVVANGANPTWESTSDAVTNGASVTGGINAAAKCLAVTFTTDNNGGKSYAMSKDVLAANDGVMFKVKLKVKDSAAEGSTSLTLQNGDSATGTTAVALVTVSGVNATTEALAISGMNVTKTINIGTASGTASKASAKDYQNQFTFNGGKADKVFVGADWGVTEKDDAITAIASGSSEEYSEKYINKSNELVLGPKSKGVNTTYTATYKDAFDLTNGFIAEYTAKGSWTTNYGDVTD